MKKKGFTLIELLVVIAIIAMLLAILMPALSKVKKIAMRVVCGTNLKGLGTAQTVYANDYDDEYVVQGQGGAHVWSDKTLNWYVTSKSWKTDVGAITTGASLFLLVREADVSPKSFVCPGGDQQEWDGVTALPGATVIPDIVEVWDFGTNAGGMGSTNCVSYSYHMPYAAGQPSASSTGSKNRYAADGTRSAAFAVMADKNPFFDEKLTIGGITADNWIERCGLLDISTNAEKWRTQVGNAQPHDREGQNVLFADGHNNYEKRADVGIKNDNIYTQWSGTGTAAGTTEASRRQGVSPTTATKNTALAPRGTEDSVLVNDDLLIE